MFHFDLRRRQPIPTLPAGTSSADFQHLMTTELKAEQARQDDEYAFPYHYVAQFRGDFRHYFLDTWSINYVSTIEFMLKRAETEPHGRIVDIGCGDGRFSRELALAFPASKVLGIDYSTRAIALASAMNPGVHNLRFVSQDITKEPSTEPFDVAMLMEVFEHIPLDQTNLFLEGVHRQLKKGGTLLLTVPHQNKALEYKHFQHFSVAQIVACLTPCFEVLEVVPFERMSPLRRIVSAILSNRLFILNNRHLLRAIYHWYKKNLFFCDSEKSCQRIFVKAVAR
jgi:2-polyprenyl-3-methyl-5-hydroxy-6-metoxy-1,4-benzoquinol methylase